MTVYNQYLYRPIVWSRISSWIDLPIDPCSLPVQRVCCIDYLPSILPCEAMHANAACIIYVCCMTMLSPSVRPSVVSVTTVTVSKLRNVSNFFSLSQTYGLILLHFCQQTSRYFASPCLPSCTCPIFAVFAFLVTDSIKFLAADAL